MGVRGVPEKKRRKPNAHVPATERRKKKTRAPRGQKTGKEAELAEEREKGAIDFLFLHGKRKRRGRN